MDLVARIRTYAGKVRQGELRVLMRMARANERLRRRVAKLEAAEVLKERERARLIARYGRADVTAAERRRLKGERGRKYGGRLVGMDWVVNPESWGPCPHCTRELPHVELADRAYHRRRLWVMRCARKAQATRRARRALNPPREPRPRPKPKRKSLPIWEPQTIVIPKAEAHRWRQYWKAERKAGRA